MLKACKTDGKIRPLNPTAHPNLRRSPFLLSKGGPWRGRPRQRTWPRGVQDSNHRGVLRNRIGLCGLLRYAIAALVIRRNRKGEYGRSFVARSEFTLRLSRETKRCGFDDTTTNAVLHARSLGSVCTSTACCAGCVDPGRGTCINPASIRIP